MASRYNGHNTHRACAVSAQADSGTQEYPGSALQRIQDLIREFEKDDAFDRKAALVGVIGLVVLVAVALVFLFSASVTTLGYALPWLSAAALFLAALASSNFSNR